MGYAYLDPATPPTELMLQWNNGSWDHRAYWGANNITYGTDGTVSRRRMGAMPAAGQWTRLEVPASQVGLEGKTIQGMAFAAWGGRVTWDAAGKASANATTAWLQPKLTPASGSISIAWDSYLGRTYRVSYKNSMSESNWIVLHSITASGLHTSVVDTNALARAQRFYMVASVN